MKRLMIVFLIWLSGVLSAVGGFLMTGNYYQYRVFTSNSGGAKEFARLVEIEGWELIRENTDGNFILLRRSRFHIP